MGQMENTQNIRWPSHVRHSAISVIAQKKYSNSTEEQTLNSTEVMLNSKIVQKHMLKKWKWMDSEKSE